MHNSGDNIYQKTFFRGMMCITGKKRYAGILHITKQRALALRVTFLAKQMEGLGAYKEEKILSDLA